MVDGDNGEDVFFPCDVDDEDDICPPGSNRSAASIEGAPTDVEERASRRGYSRLDQSLFMARWQRWHSV